MEDKFISKYTFLVQSYDHSVKYIEPFIIIIIITIIIIIIIIIISHFKSYKIKRVQVLTRY